MSISYTVVCGKRKVYALKVAELAANSDPFVHHIVTSTSYNDTW